MAVNCVILLGGLFGWDGWVTSAGMLGLANQLKAIGCNVSCYTWNDWHSVPQSDVVIGYSGGGSRATYLEFPMKLLVAYDPSPSWQMQPIGTNVAKAICYYNASPAMPSFYGWLGGGKLTGDCKQIITYMIAEQHLLVQFDQGLHAMTVQAVKDLL